MARLFDAFDVVEGLVFPEKSHVVKTCSIREKSTLIQAPGRLTRPSSKWMPHSVFSSSDHRPALGSSSSCTGLVCGSQPMLL
jgi:hypothetical protein